jgi:hypothetical protein
MIAGVDAQLALPGMVLDVQFAVMLKHPLTATLDPQFTFLLANLAIQLIISLCAIESRQRYLTHVANTPVSVQRLTQLARQAVLMLGAQA